MTRREMLDELRGKIDDTSGRPKWTTGELLGWMAEGQDKFCEDTGFFTDVSSFSLTTVIGQAVYDISERIIEVKDLWRGNTRLGKYQEYMKTVGYPTSNAVFFNPNQADVAYYWQADEETGVLTLYPTPTTVETLTMRVWRYSKFSLDSNDVDGKGLNAEPEIPFRFHRACIEWAAYKAYSDHDAEKGDAMGAKDHLEAFKAYVSDGKKAIRRRQSEKTTVNGNPTYVVR